MWCSPFAGGEQSKGDQGQVPLLSPSRAVQLALALGGEDLPPP